LQSFIASFDGELDTLSLIQGFEPLYLDSRVMHKHIIFTFTGDETEAFGGIEPLDDTNFTLTHRSFLPFDY